MNNLNIGGGWRISWNRLPEVGTFELGLRFESLFCAQYREDFLVCVDWNEPKNKKQKPFRADKTLKGNLLGEAQADTIEEILVIAQGWIDEISIGRTDNNEIFHVRDQISRFPKKALKQPTNEYSAASGSGKHHFKATEYEHKFPSGDGSWRITKVEIFESNTNQKIGEYTCEYHRKAHAWLTIGENDYLFLPEPMDGQSVFDCTNQQLHSHKTGSNELIWANIYPSPDGQKLAVMGCIWANAYEVAILDISNINALPYPELHRFKLEDDWDVSHWNSEIALVLKDTEGYSKYVFPYENLFCTEGVVEMIDAQNLKNERILQRIEDKSGKKRLISFKLTTNSAAKMYACQKYFMGKDYVRILPETDVENKIYALHFLKYQDLNPDEIENFTSGMINLAASFFDMKFEGFNVPPIGNWREENGRNANDQWATLAQNEILNPTFETTKHYLTKLKVESENGKPKVHFIRQTFDNEAIVHFKIEYQLFYLSVYLAENAVRWVATQPNTQVYFRATSETLRLKEMQKFTKITPTSSMDIGEKRKGGKTKYTFSAFHFEPNTEGSVPFKIQLLDLLDALETDKFGINELTRKTDAAIQVCSHDYVGNGELGGFHLDKKLTKRLANLGLAIDFDCYAEGESS